MLGNKYPEKQHVTMMSCPVVVGNITDWPLEMNISISTDNRLVNRSTLYETKTVGVVETGLEAVRPVVVQHSTECTYVRSVDKVH